MIFQYRIQFATFYWLQICLLLQIGTGNSQSPSVGVKNGKRELDGAVALWLRQFGLTPGSRWNIGVPPTPDLDNVFKNVDMKGEDLEVEPIVWPLQHHWTWGPGDRYYQNLRDFKGHAGT